MRFPASRDAEMPQECKIRIVQSGKMALFARVRTVIKRRIREMNICTLIRVYKFICINTLDGGSESAILSPAIIGNFVNRASGHVFISTNSSFCIVLSPLSSVTENTDVRNDDLKKTGVLYVFVCIIIIDMFTIFYRSTSNMQLAGETIMKRDASEIFNFS